MDMTYEIPICILKNPKKYIIIWLQIGERFVSGVVCGAATRLPKRRKNGMKKIFSVVLSAILALALGAASLAGCSGRTETSREPGEIIGGDVPDTDIVLRVEAASPLRYNYQALLRNEEEGSSLYMQAEFTQALVEGFKDLYPNITLQFIDDGWGASLWQQQQLYIRDWQQGQTPQIDLLIGETYMGYMAENGVFAALDSTKFEDVVEIAYSDMVVENSDGSSSLYGVPMDTGILGLQYNTEILREAGIPEEQWEPATWSELLNNCRIVAKYAEEHGKDYTGIIMNALRSESSAIRALPFMRAAGGDFLDESGNFNLSSEENIEAFTFLRSLAQYTDTNILQETNEDNVQRAFTEGGAAYFVEGQWTMVGADDAIRSCELPTTDDGGVGNCFNGNYLYGVASWSENKEAAQAFLEYLTSEEMQLLIYEKTGRLPINENVLNGDEVLTIYPTINSYIYALREGGFEGGIPCIEQNSQTVWELWGSFYNNVLTTDTSIAELAAAADSSINSRLS